MPRPGPPRFHRRDSATELLPRDARHPFDTLVLTLFDAEALSVIQYRCSTDAYGALAAGQRLDDQADSVAGRMRSR